MGLAGRELCSVVVLVTSNLITSWLVVHKRVGNQSPNVVIGASFYF